jgi:hypothetical protein
MRRILVCGAVALVPMVGAAVAQEPKVPNHTLVSAADLKWGEPPPAFEKGLSFTVVSGDPGKAGTFVVRLKIPAGYKIAPHTHPTGSGLFALTYVNPAEDPTQRAAGK